MVIRAEMHTYDVSKALAKTPWANYYLCRDMASERWLILMIAESLDKNSVLERVEYGLGRMKDYANAYEETYAEEQRAEGATEIKLLHYDWLFPQVYDTFLAPEQGNRRILILDFPDANLADGMPLMQIEQKGLRVDLKTSAWIAGRILKLLSFLHGSDVWMVVNYDNYFLIPNQHRLLLLDFSSLLLESEYSPGRRLLDLQRAAKTVLRLLGVTWQGAEWTYDYELEREDEDRYLTFWLALYRGCYDDALLAYQSFYKVVHELWGRSFHPFTALPR